MNASMLRHAATPVLALLLAGCTTPELPQSVDAAPVPPDAELDCEPLVDGLGTGYHNPGTACLDCHQGQQPSAPFFTLAGTVFKDAAGTLPARGATVIVVDGDGTVIKMPTQLNGNFWSSVPLAPPLTTVLSRCPDNIPMISNFVDGDCNSCHGGVGDPGRIVLGP
jgi:hypothetical protein